jgi:hypothetical protein
MFNNFFLETPAVRVIEKIKTRVLCSITFLETPVVYKVMWKYTAHSPIGHMPV